MVTRANLAQKTFEAPASSLAVIKEIIDELEVGRIRSTHTDVVIEHELDFIVRITGDFKNLSLVPIERVRRSLIELAAAAVSAVDAIDLQESQS